MEKEEVALAGEFLLCFGGESSGLRARSRKWCDRLVGLPMRGRVGSLNVATAAADTLGAAGLFVLAPAYYMPGYEALTPTPAAPHIVIVHGWGDEVVPAANSIRWAQAHGAELHLIRGDHRLADRLTAINRLFDGFLQYVPAAT